MATREALEDRKEALEAELARREASRSTSERQAAYVTGRGRSEDVAEDDAEDRDEMDDERAAWGDERARHESGSSTSRRQAARVTRGASRGGEE